MTARDQRESNRIAYSASYSPNNQPTKSKRKATIIIKRMQKYEQSIDNNKQAANSPSSRSPQLKKFNQGQDQTNVKQGLFPKQLHNLPQIIPDSENRQSKLSTNIQSKSLVNSKLDNVVNEKEFSHTEKTPMKFERNPQSLSNNPFIVNDQLSGNGNFANSNNKSPKTTNRNKQDVEELVYLPCTSAQNSPDKTDHSHLQQRESHHYPKFSPKQIVSSSHNIRTSPVNVSSNPIKVKVPGMTQSPRQSNRDEPTGIKQNNKYQQQNIKATSVSPSTSRKLVDTKRQLSPQKQSGSPNMSYLRSMHSSSDDKKYMPTTVIE